MPSYVRTLRLFRAGKVHQCRLIFTSVIFLVFAMTAFSQRGNPRYTQRGNYWEGVKEGEASGRTLILVSALAGSTQQAGGTPETFNIRFYLNRDRPVYIVVRELRNDTYYWLDNVRASWQRGYGNDFVWPTSRVIQQLGLSMDKLGVVARLDKEQETADEWIAPVIFYDDHSEPPRTVNQYEFTFRAGKEATFDYDIYRQGSQSPVFSRKGDGRVNAGSPFSIEWDASRVDEGDYVLQVRLIPASSNTPIYQTITFYHKRIVE